MVALSVEDLFFAYDDKTILEDVSFSVATGEFIALFGPNGGGKTTLLSLLMGFLKPLRGKITLPTSHKIGWVPQSFHYDRQFPITVKEVVLMGRLHALSWRGRFAPNDVLEAKKALQLVGLSGWEEIPFAALSGGQAQRVLLARALAGNPSLLFLDEPTANVDFEAQKAICNILDALKGKLTILMVTHDLKIALERADRLFCVQRAVTVVPRERVCQHFSLGLYHPI